MHSNECIDPAGQVPNPIAMTYREHIDECARKYWREMWIKHNRCITRLCKEAKVNRSDFYERTRRLGIFEEFDMNRGNEAWRALSDEPG